MAITTRPIGLAESAAFSSHCTPAQTLVATATTPCIAAQAAVAALTAHTTITSPPITAASVVTRVLFSLTQVAKPAKAVITDAIAGRSAVPSLARAFSHCAFAIR